MRRSVKVLSVGFALALAALAASSCDHAPSGEKQYSYLKELLVDTALVRGRVVSGDSVLVVCRYPGGCNRLDSAALEAATDTLHIRMIYEFYYRGEPCAHGPGVDSVYVRLRVPAPGEYFIAYRNADSSLVVIPLTILPSHS